jgi:hypothetical protein
LNTPRYNGNFTELQTEQNMVDYKTLVTVSAVVLTLLGLGWTLKGESMLKRWRLEPNAVALLVGRRIGTIYLGVSVLLLCLRSLSSPEAQLAVSTGGAAFALLLALIGIYEYVRGRVAPSILVSVAAELLLAIGFIALAMR